MKRLLFLFLDGVGLGTPNPETNPLLAAETPHLDSLFSGPLHTNLQETDGRQRVVRRLDACLGVDGLPQSATGQTTLLTGKNAAQHMGRHYGPWPGPTLKALLDQGTVFSEVVAAGRLGALANAYPPGYFQAVTSGRRRVSVPVYAAQHAGLRLRTLQDYAAGEAIAADLSGSYFRQLDASLPLRGEAAAGETLAILARHNSFTFFDYWLTDEAGHRGSWDDARKVVEGLDRFLSGLLPLLDDTTLLLTSDHGNLEDKAVRTHTLNPVPLLAVGPGANVFAACTSLQDVAPAIRRFFSAERPAGWAG